MYVCADWSKIYMLSVNDDHQVLCKGAFSINRKVADSNKLKVCVAFLIPYLLFRAGCGGLAGAFSMHD